MGKVNPLERGINKVVKEFNALRKAANASDTVPIGQERLSTRQAASRLQNMSEGQKQGMIDSLGIDEVMKIVRSIKS